MRVAYCIICHRNNNILRTTIEILSKDNDIYLHVDKKTNINQFYEYKDKVHYIRKRVNVKWGGYSQIECMLALLAQANKINYDYICLLSGDCLPLKSSYKIKSFFIKNNGKEFIGIEKDFNKEILENRLKYKYNSLYLKRNKNNFEKILFKIQNKIMPPKINNLYKSLPKLYKGCNWFCISGELCAYILKYVEKNKWYENAFKYSRCGDEEFFQTIVMNSKYKDRIYKYNTEYDDNHMALRYIDWNSGPEYPKVLSENDFSNIKNVDNSDCIFARKFNNNINIDNYKNEFNII